MSLKTPFGKVRGLGSECKGSGHFIAQRVTALALVILVPLFLYQMVTSYAGGYEAAIAWIGSPLGAVGLFLLLTAGLHHMRLGLAVVIEDYIHKHGTKFALLVLNAFIAYALWAAGVYAVLKIALGG